MPRLEIRNVMMEFPAVRALDGVSLSFAPGEVHGLVGENGAGKSTLMKILAGVQSPSSGEVELDGQVVHFGGVRDALRHGIAMIHQELNLVDELTVAENVFLGSEFRRGIVLDRDRMNAEAAELLRAVSASFPPTTRVRDLSIAGKQLVEVAKALAAHASILIMDEPTAVLSEPESEALFRLIADLKERGVTVIYISHRLAEVLRICDRITVLRDGALVRTFDTSPTVEDLAANMVGRPLQDVYPAKSSQPEGAPLLEVQGLQVGDHVKEASFSVRKGEVLGIAGLVGAGRTELCEAIVGARPVTNGTIHIDGQPARIRHPKDALRYGLAYLSEDRKGLGLILDLSNIANVTLANLGAYASPILNKAKERESAERHRTELDIRARDLDAPTLFLSGGNQQKVALAKWLDAKPKVLILDEPTRGVDVGAKREIYALIHRFAEAGMACIVVSSEMPEIIGLCHRTLVMREGRIVGELSETEMTEPSILHLAAGVAA
ncbi:sugar ABC transporter ATP-binding protein [bacterium]|nr:MAG: sugar ABC transporter ATP-binding protein [bacterium]